MVQYNKNKEMGLVVMYFMSTPCFIEGNEKLREPQREAYIRVLNHFTTLQQNIGDKVWPQQ